MSPASSVTNTASDVRLFAPPSPPLPKFENLLVKGPYAPTAPIHLCLSYLGSQPHAQQRTALLLSPDRERFTSSLEEYNEEWLTTSCMTGSVASSLSRMKILYPATLEHLLLILSLVRPITRTPNPSYKSTVLPEVPGLVVLHEPSRYFQSSPDKDFTLSQYLHLVILTLDTASYLKHCDPEIGHIPVALFDSELDSLRLPIFKSMANYEQSDSPKRRERVVALVEKYFRTRVTMEDMSCSSSQPEEAMDADPSPFQCTITTLDDGITDTFVWRWTEYRQFDATAGKSRTVCSFR